MAEENKLEKIVSLCKRRGFVFQGSEIYGGLAGTYDYGHHGYELARNIKELWWNHFVQKNPDVYGSASSTIMPEKVWEASGHLSGFTDPVVQCSKCKSFWRTDKIIESQHPIDGKFLCPYQECRNPLGSEEEIQKMAKPFNLMFEVKMGVGGDTTSYLRGEIAQGMFVNFKNYIDTLHPQLPFGVAQIGKAYRNEIAPRDFLFRVREFDLMEFEYFVRENEWEKHFEKWRREMWDWVEKVGIDKKLVHELDVPDGERAHYSKRTIDFEFDYPFGRKELYGLAYRTDYDLKKHMEHSGVDLNYTNPESGEKFIPHVIEPSMGHDRTMLAVLLSAYREDELGGEKRIYLAFKPSVAPVKVAVFPLLRNKPELVKKAKEIFENLQKEFGAVEFDDNGNIGKRYRRQDEIGTPFCVTIDFNTLEDNSITIRDRDTGKQERISEKDLVKYLQEKLC